MTRTPAMALLGLVIALAAPSSAVADAEVLPLGVTATEENFLELGQNPAVRPAGGFAIAWTEGIPLGSGDLRHQWVDGDGEALFEAGGRVVATDAHSGVVAAHPAGVYVGYLKDNLFHAQSFDVAGDAVWADEGVLLADRLLGSETQAEGQVVIASDGLLVGCFATLNPATVRCQKVDGDGNRLWGSTGALASTDDGIQTLPRVVPDGAGGAMVFWRRQTGTGVTLMEMKGQRLDSSGGAQWGAAGLTVRSTNLPATGNHGLDFYGVVPDGEGGAILAFDDLLSGGNELDVGAQRVSGAGTVLWPDPTVVAADVDTVTVHEATVAGPGGGVFVVVRDSISSTRSVLRAFRLDADGDHVWPASGQEVSDPAATALEFGAYGDWDGSILRLVWTHQEVPATFTMDVKLARYTAAGARLDPPEGLPVISDDDAQFARGLAYDPGNELVVALWDDRRGNDDTYAGLLDGAPVIFADGFESGDTSAWSATVP